MLWSLVLVGPVRTLDSSDKKNCRQHRLCVGYGEHLIVTNYVSIFTFPSIVTFIKLAGFPQM